MQAATAYLVWHTVEGQTQDYQPLLIEQLAVCCKGFVLPTRAGEKGKPIADISVLACSHHRSHGDISGRESQKVVELTSVRSKQLFLNSHCAASLLGLWSGRQGGLCPGSMSQVSRGPVICYLVCVET